ncbi:MAG: SIS domain-containing protein [Cellvibrionales bacterium]|nr:SIS domain-containing protein [Cellvibrionales bacterium]
MTVFDSLLEAYEEQKHFHEFLESELTPHIAEASTLLVETLNSGHKILTTASIDIEAFAAQTSKDLLQCSDFERPSFASMHIPFIENPHAELPTQTLAPATSALMNKGDCVILLASQQSEAALLEVIELCKASKNPYILICNVSNQTLINAASDLSVCIPIPDSRFCKFHYYIISIILETIEKSIFEFV